MSKIIQKRYATFFSPGTGTRLFSKSSDKKMTDCKVGVD